MASGSERPAASTRGIIVGVGGFRVIDCATGRDHGTFDTREEAEAVQRGCPKHGPRFVCQHERDVDYADEF